MNRKKQKNRLVSMLCSVAMLLSMIPLGVTAAESKFSDMPQDWSTKALEAAVANGLLQGFDGKIMAQAPLSRAEMATIINRAFGATKTASILKFSDLKQGDWFFTEFEKAVAMKTFEGADGKMNPSQGITREQAFLVLARALALKEADASILASFSDANTVSAWAKTGMASMVKAGYTHGADGKLNPQQIITRAEFAQIMDNIVKTYIKTPGTVKEVVEGSVMINVPDVILENVTVKGNLILGDGVGEGDITLNNVKVEGDTIIRGGGINSIVVKGSSSLGNVVISKVDGNVRVSVQGDAKVEVIYIEDGKNDVKVEGSVNTISIQAAVPVTLANATVKTLDIEVAAQNAKVTVEKGTTVTTANVKASGVELSGAGKVTTANIKANDAKVETVGATVNVDKGVTGATSNGHTLEPGKTSTTTQDKPTVPSGGGGGGGGGGTTTYVYNAEVSVTYGDKGLTCQDNNNAATDKLYTNMVEATLTASKAQDLMVIVARNLDSAKFEALNKSIENRRSQLFAYIEDAGNAVNVDGTSLSGLKAFVAPSGPLSLDHYMTTGTTSTIVSEKGNAGPTLVANMKALHDGILSVKAASGRTEYDVVNFLCGFVQEAIKSGVCIQVNGGANISSEQIKTMISAVRNDVSVSDWYATATGSNAGLNNITVSGLALLPSATVTFSLERK